MQHFDHHHGIECTRRIIDFFPMHGYSAGEPCLLHLVAGLGQAFVVDVDSRQSRARKGLGRLQQEISGAAADFQDRPARGKTSGKIA